MNSNVFLMEREKPNGIIDTKQAEVLFLVQSPIRETNWKSLVFLMEGNGKIKDSENGDNSDISDNDKGNISNNDNNRNIKVNKKNRDNSNNSDNSTSNNDNDNNDLTFLIP